MTVHVPSFRPASSNKSHHPSIPPLMSFLSCFQSLSDAEIGKWVHLLEVQVFEGEVGLHDAGGFHSGPQHVLLGGDVAALRYPVQIVQVAGKRARDDSECF